MNGQTGQRPRHRRKTSTTMSQNDTTQRPSWPRETAPPQGMVSVDTLIAYHEGTLPTADASQCQAQLMRSAAARQELLDLAAFPDLSSDNDASPVAVDDAWQRFAATLDAEAARETVVPLTRPVPRPATRRWLAMAAAAALAVLGLSITMRPDAPASTEPTTLVIATLGFEPGQAAPQTVVYGRGPQQTTAPATAGKTVFSSSFEDGQPAGWTLVESDSTS